MFRTGHSMFLFVLTPTMGAIQKTVIKTVLPNADSVNWVNISEKVDCFFDVDVCVWTGIKRCHKLANNMIIGNAGFAGFCNRSILATILIMNMLHSVRITTILILAGYLCIVKRNVCAV